MNDSYYIYPVGELRQKDNTIRFISSEDNTYKDIPIERIKEIYIMNEVTVTSKMLGLFSKYGVVVHFFNYYHNYIGSFYPKEDKLAGQILVKQALAYNDDSERLKIAMEFIRAGSFNIYRNLRYYNGRGKDVSEYMKNIETFRKKLDDVKTINELMGVEGNIRKEYYKAWNTIIDQEINFKKRVYYPPDNRINSLISFVNSVIYTKTITEIYKTQLNPTISFLHQPGKSRFSLALDISEIFKPVIADRLIFSLLNKNQITKSSFREDLNGLKLTEKGSKTVMMELEKTLERTVHHKDLNKNVSYQYLMRLEAYKLIKHIIGEKEYKGFEMWW